MLLTVLSPVAAALASEALHFGPISSVVHTDEAPAAGGVEIDDSGGRKPILPVCRCEGAWLRLILLQPLQATATNQPLAFPVKKY